MNFWHKAGHNKGGDESEKQGNHAGEPEAGQGTGSKRGEYDWQGIPGNPGLDGQIPPILFLQPDDPDVS